MATWIIVFLIALVVLLVIVRRRPSIAPRATPKPQPPPENGEYHSVEVRFREGDCCEWVKNLKDARLLPHQARLFPLPLPECDAARCRCRYVHFPDRRGEDDRRMPFSALYSAFGRFSTDERRNGRERRKDFVTQESRIATDLHVALDSPSDSSGV